MQQSSEQTALYRAAQVREIERAAMAAGRTAPQLMARAAGAAWQLLQRRWPLARRIHVLAGPGDNGGDGLWMAALAQAAGCTVSVSGLAGRARSGAGAEAEARARAAGVRWLDAAAPLPQAEVFVDALFGIGLDRAPEGVAAAWIEALNAQPVPVLALDLPSGLLADTGAVPGVAVRAVATQSFVRWKRGLFTGRARAHCGLLQLHTLDIGAGAVDDAPDARLLQPRRLPLRAADAHKGRYGHVLVIGGEQGYAGAVRLAGEAALRGGAGRVSLATREAHAAALVAQRPELMAHGIEDAAAFASLCGRASVLAIGPGLGQRIWGERLLDAALASGKPLVCDADALNLVARRALLLPAGSVLTPHPGEAARLLDCSVAAVESDRFAAVRRLASRHASVVVLKGAGTLVADAAGRVEVCTAGNPGMASGGMGDVLTGIIAALRAQGMDAWDAARLGVDLHARAGDVAASAHGPRGLLASDLLLPLRGLLNAND